MTTRRTMTDDAVKSMAHVAMNLILDLKLMGKENLDLVKDLDLVADFLEQAYEEGYMLGREDENRSLGNVSKALTKSASAVDAWLASRPGSNDNGDFDDERFCEHCGKDTIQTYHDAGHERDSSGNYWTCKTCGERERG